MKIDKKQVGTDLHYVFGDDLKVIDYWVLIYQKEEQYNLGYISLKSEGDDKGYFFYKTHTWGYENMEGIKKLCNEKYLNVYKFPTKEEGQEYLIKVKEAYENSYLYKEDKPYTNFKLIPIHKELKEGDTIPLIVEEEEIITEKEIGFDFIDPLNIKSFTTRVINVKYKVGECTVGEFIFDHIELNHQDNDRVYLLATNGYGAYMSLIKMKELGYTNQKYAIKVKDIIWFDEEHSCITKSLDIDDDGENLTSNGSFCPNLKCNYCMNNNCRYYYKRKDDGCGNCNKPTEPIKEG